MGAGIVYPGGASWDVGLKDRVRTEISTSMERPLGLAEIPERMFAKLTTGMGYYVLPSRLSEDQRRIVRAAFGKSLGFKIRASPKGDAYIKRAVGFRGECVELWKADFVAQAAFPVHPKAGAHYKPHEAVPYVAFRTMETLGYAPAEDNFLPADVCNATVDEVLEGKVVLRPRSDDYEHGWSFATFPAMVRRFPAAKAALLEMIAPGLSQPDLPTYEVQGLKGRWVTSADFVRVVDATIESARPSLTEEASLAEWSCNPKYATLGADGELQACCKNKGSSTPIVSEAWITKKKQAWLSPILCSMGPANMDVPIVTGVHPVRGGVRAREAQAAKEGAIKKPRKSSVKMTLKSRLKDPEMEKLIEAVVDSISAASRYGSYLLNLHLMRVLDAAEGVLPDVGPDVFTLEHTVRRAMAAVRFQRPKHEGLAQTVAECPELLELVDTSLPETGNSLNREATGYATTVHTTMQLAGPNRICTLMNAACKLYGVSAKGAAHSIVQYVRGYGKLSIGLPDKVTLLADKYRKVYSEKGLHDSYGFRIHDIVGEPCKEHRVRRVLELYWLINQDLMNLETSALAQGWTKSTKHCNIGRSLRSSTLQLFEEPDTERPVEDNKVKVWARRTFAFLPVSSLKRRHVRIDNQSFQRALDRVTHDIDSTKYEASDFSSIFLEGVPRRQDVRKIKKSGAWTMGPSFLTDGRSLVVTYISKTEGAPSKNKAGDMDDVEQWTMIPEGAIVVGDDPGRKNTHYTCQRVSDGTIANADFACERVPDGAGGWLQFKVQTRVDHYAELDKTKKRAEARHVAKASEAIAALSAKRRRTTSMAEFRQYVATMARWKNEFKEAYGCRAACSEAFTNYRTKTGAMDRFIASFVEKDAMVYYALGDANFNSTGRGEKSVPTTSYGKRIDKAFKESILRVPVDEWNTTKMDSVTMTELAPAWRTMTDSVGRLRYIQDRDVRFCTSELLGSYHPCAAKLSLMEGLLDAPEGYIGVDRDRNSAFAMLKLAGLRNEERPPVYIRPNKQT